MAFLYDGSGARVIVAREDVYGVDRGPAATPRAIPFTREGLRNAIRYFQSQIISDKRMVLNAIQGQADPSGEVNMEVTSRVFPTFMWYTLGGLKSTTAGSPWTHTIWGTKLGLDGSASGQAVGQLSFTMERGLVPDDTSHKRFFPITGCKVARATITYPTSGPQTGTFRVVGRSDKALVGSTIRNSSVFTATPIQSFGNIHTSFLASARFFDQATSGGTTITDTNSKYELWLSDCRIDINNQTREDIYRMGSRDRFAAPMSRRIITGTMRMFVFDGDAAGPDALTTTSLEMLETYYLQGGSNIGSLSIISTLTAGADAYLIRVPALRVADIGGGGGVGIAIENESTMEVPFPFVAIDSSNKSTGSETAPSSPDRGVAGEDLDIALLWQNTEQFLTY